MKGLIGGLKVVGNSGMVRVRLKDRGFGEGMVVIDSGLKRAKAKR